MLFFSLPVLFTCCTLYFFLSSLLGMVSGKAGTREAPSVQSRKRLDLGSAVEVQGKLVNFVNPRFRVLLL